MIYSREEILAARAGMPQSWKRTARWRMGTDIDAVETSEAVGLSKGGFDWSSQTALGASFSDFDRKALTAARAQLEQRLGARAERLKGIDNEALLNKMGAMVNGVPTHGALLVLGKASSDSHLAGLVPRMVFTRYDANGQVQQKANVRMPFLTGIERLVEIICATGVYPEEPVRELLVNAIAHCDYLKRGNIQISDAEGTLSITNPGAWGKGSPVAALRKDFDPTPMRNPALCRLMVQCGVMDAFGLGVAHTRMRLCDLGMPAVEYDLTDPDNVTAMLHSTKEASERSHKAPPSMTETVAAKGEQAAAEESEAPEAKPAEQAFFAAAVTADTPAVETGKSAVVPTRNEDVKELIFQIVKQGRGVTRAEVVEELVERGYNDTGDKFIRRVGRLLDKLHKEGRIRKGNPDKRHWYLA